MTPSKKAAIIRSGKWFQRTKVVCGDALTVLRRMPDALVQCVVTSPPYYGLRDYGVAGQIGLEESPDAYVARLVEVFREVRRVLKPDGVLWLNLGDSYNAAGRKGHGTRIGYKQGTNRASRGGEDHTRSTDDKLKPKDLIGIPWRVAFALQADGWYLRQDIVWSKPNAMPESVTDRCTRSHEYLFMLTKQERYYYSRTAVREKDSSGNLSRKVNNQPGARSKFGTGVPFEAGGGRNRRSVWTINTRPYRGAHFATFPPKLVEPCILAGSRPGDIVLDPFAGAGTTLAVAKVLGRRAIGLELNPSYCDLIAERLSGILLADPLFPAPTP